MKKLVLAIFALLLISFANQSVAQSDTIRPVHVGIVYPISSNGLNAAKYTNRFSLHAVAGLSANETFMTIAGATNLIRNNASGFQIAGALNLIGSHASGLQMAGFGNFIGGQAVGWQMAGALNLADSTQGAAIAGFGNINKHDANGLQLAGVINRAEDVDVQISGAVNIARKVHGVQLAGLVNIADTSDYPIALFNFIKSGEKSVSITIDETMTVLATFRSGGKYLYGITGLGYNLKDNDKPLYAIEAGLGGHIPVTQSFRVNVEAVNLALSDFKKGTYMKSTLRILPAYRISQRLEIFAGPTLNYVNYSKEKGKGLIDKYLWSQTKPDDFKGLFLGFTGGIQILL